MEKASVTNISTFRAPVIVASKHLETAIMNAVRFAAEKVGKDAFAQSVCTHEAQCEQIAA